MLEERSQFKKFREKAKEISESIIMPSGDPFMGPMDSNDVMADNMDTSWSVNDFNSRSELLGRVNAYIGQIAQKEYLNPMIPLRQIENRLQLLGMYAKVPTDMKEYSTGYVSVPVQRFGGRFGTHPTEGWTNDDGWDGEGYILALHTEVTDGMFRVHAELVPESQENEEENETFDYEEDENPYYEDDDDEMVMEEKVLKEAAPPDPQIEQWIIDNKKRFQDEYGAKWQEALYGRAWVMYNNKQDKKKEEAKKVKNKNEPRQQ